MLGTHAAAAADDPGPGVDPCAGRACAIAGRHGTKPGIVLDAVCLPRIRISRNHLFGDSHLNSANQLRHKLRWRAVDANCYHGRMISEQRGNFCYRRTINKMRFVLAGKADPRRRIAVSEQLDKHPRLELRRNCLDSENIRVTGIE